MIMQFQKKDPRATITTKFGEIKIKFYPDDAPRHVENFINLAKMGFYDDTTLPRRAGVHHSGRRSAEQDA